MMIILTMVFLIVDILSKLIVSNLLNVYDSIKIINNFFYITYVRNTGAAWSIFSGETLGLIIFSLIIISLIIYYVLKNILFYTSMYTFLWRGKAQCKYSSI